MASMPGLKDFLSLNQFNSRLQELHAKARGGSLDPAERAAYERCRSDLARMLVFAQQLTRRPSETFRQALRVPLALKVEVETTAKHREQTVTIDVSTGGFAAILLQPCVSGETWTSAGTPYTATSATPGWRCAICITLSAEKFSPSLRIQSSVLPLK